MVSNMVEMTRREPTDEENAELREAVRVVSWHRARLLSGLENAARPRSPFDADVLDAAGQSAAVLAHLAALRDVRDAAQELIDLTVSVAGANGAGGEAIGKTLGVSRVAVRKKWPDAVAGASGPRKPEFTTLGSDAWTGQPDVPAEQDWLVRARVRLRQDLRNTAWKIDRSDGGEKLQMVERYAQAGEEFVMVMRGRAGTDVTLDYWSTEEPPRQALLADNHQLQVLEVLAVIPPWPGFDLVAEVIDPMRADVYEFGP
jgi:hypothetical protein